MSNRNFERNFGDRGAAVREMDCLCVPALRDWDFDEPVTPDVPAQCSSHHIQAAHVTPRGMGGCNSDRRQLVPLCPGHHRESGEGSKREQQPSARVAFEKRYRFVMKDEAERIAIELDERGIP